MLWVVPVLLASTLLNAAYFLPLLGRIWFRPTPSQWPAAHSLPGLVRAALVIPAVLTALMALAVGLLGGLDYSPLGWVRLIVGREYVQ